MKNALCIIPLTLLFVFGCSSNATVDKSLYSDSEELIKLFYESVENGTFEFNEELEVATDKFKAKYDLTKDNWSTEEWDLLYTTNDITINYLEYRLNEDEKYLKDFYDNVEKMNSEYNMNF